MEIKELLTFKKIVEVGSFSKAAIELHYVQSSVTMQMKKLEAELGYLLFDRENDMKLTEEGQLFLMHSNELILHWNYVLDYSSFLKNEEVGCIKMGVIDQVLLPHIPEIINYMKELKPNITFNIKVGSSVSLQSLLLNEEIDFYIGGKPKSQSRFIYDHLYNENLIFIIDKQYENLYQDIILKKDIENLSLVTAESSCMSFQKLSETLQDFNILSPELLIGNVGVIPHFISNTKRIGLVFSGIKIDDNIKIIPFEEEINFPIGIISLRKDIGYLGNTKTILFNELKKKLGN